MDCGFESHCQWTCIFAWYGPLATLSFQIVSVASKHHGKNNGVIQVSLVGTTSETWITRTAGDHQKTFSNEKFELWVILSFSYESCSPFALTRVMSYALPLLQPELWVMLSLCLNHVATVASLFRSSVFHFLAKLSKICEIFLSREKKTTKLSLLHKNVNTSSHIKGNLMAPTTVFSSSYDWKFEICLANYHYPGRDHETWSELSEFSSYPRSSQPSFTAIDWCQGGSTVIKDPPFFSVRVVGVSVGDVWPQVHAAGPFVFCSVLSLMLHTDLGIVSFYYTDPAQTATSLQ